MLKEHNRSVWDIAVVAALFLIMMLLLFVLTDSVKVAYAEELVAPTTFDKYLRDEYSNTMSFDEAELVINVAGDDKIVEYIPKECFMQEGQYMHINDDYGYYIYTFPDGIFANPSGEFTSFGNMTLGDVFDLFKN